MNLQELVAKRAEVLASMEKLNNDNPQMNEETETKYNTLNSEFKALSRKIDLAKTNNKLAAEVDDIILPANASVTATAEYRNGFDAYIAGADISEYKNVMSEGVDEDGGYTVPQTYEKTVLEKLNTLGLTRSISTTISTTSTRNIAIEGEAPTFAWIEEKGTYGETGSTFGNKQIKAHKLGGIIKVSDELLSDSMINFEAYMANQIAKGIDKAESPVFCIGDGVNKPTGYLTNLTSSVTTASTAAVTADELIDIYYSLPEAYRKTATWRMNDKTVKAIRKLKDSDGNYIFDAALTQGERPTLLGRPIVTDNEMPLMATGNKFVVFGAFDYYQIGNRGNMEIRRLNEKYADEGLVGFRVTVRVDAKRLLDEAFVAGQNA